MASISGSSATVTDDGTTVTVTLASVGPQGPAGPAPEWGNITGTLGDQTDLNSALAGKASTADLATKAPATCLYLPGVSGNYVSVPDSAALDITGDLDIIVRVALDDWTPASINTLVGKYTASNISYQFRVNTDGKLGLVWTTDGTTQISQASSAATGLTDGAAKWVRVTLDVDNGAGGYDLKWFLSDDGTTWTQLGTTVTGGTTTSVFAGTAALDIGSRTAGTAALAIGKFYRAIVKNGIDGTTVLDWRADIPATRYRDAYGNVCTVNGTSNGWMVA
jgi:hypothetical protein